MDHGFHWHNEPSLMITFIIYLYIYIFRVCNMTYHFNHYETQTLPFNVFYLRCAITMLVFAETSSETISASIHTGVGLIRYKFFNIMLSNRHSAICQLLVDHLSWACLTQTEELRTDTRSKRRRHKATAVTIKAQNP